MPYNNKNRGTEKPPIVQWLNKKTDSYEKIERATGEVVSVKVTPGPYKKLELVKRRPRRRTVKSPVRKLTKTTRKKIEKAVKAVKAAKPAKKKPVKKKKKKAKKKVVVKKKRKVNYLNNKDLLAEVIMSKEQDQMTDKLARMLMMLCARYGRRGNFANYTYNEDMQAYAMMMLVRTWRSFKPEKSNNPFAFFTQCVKNSFIQFLNQEKRHRNLRDELMVDKGLNPSYTYQLEHEQRNTDRRKELAEERANPLTEPREVKKDDELVGY